ncbi:MAG: protein translocase subunit SecD [Bryobacteraceae bacterium]|nr:protein translocase subunit SecD [Bryobacteraceae bacterium]
MSKVPKWKAIVIIATVLICLYGMIGLPKSKQELAANWNHNIRLGLDLRGGSLLVLQIQLQDAFKADATASIERMKELMSKNSIAGEPMMGYEPKSLQDADRVEVLIKGVPADSAKNFRSIVGEEFGAWVLTPVGPSDYRMTMKPTEAGNLKKETLARSISTIENRINSLGLSEATVQERQGSGADAEILVSLPGTDDPDRIKSILKTAALLELYEVKSGPFKSEVEALASFNGVKPLGTKLMPSMKHADAQDAGWFVVTSTPVITGRDLRDARASQDEVGKAETNFVISQDAKGRFGRFTEANIGNRLAIALDGQIKMAPRINARIEDNGVIEGVGTQQDAQDLAIMLRSGSLPAGVKYLQESTVGPSLGADSIRSGLMSGLVGLIAVIFIMLVYYARSGINATVALLLNAIILIGVLAYVGAVLTLPGIAGIILLIGMAVDSNVLIFERIREELRAGKVLFAAIDAGFGKAFLTIIDTHVTTVVSCAFLFMFGTPAVRGFAVTLVIGLVANLFTSVFVSRYMFDLEYSGPNPSLSIGIKV